MNLRGFYANENKENLIYDNWLSKKLVNKFPSQNATYSENEVEGLIRMYQHSSHPRSNQIVILLQSLSFVLSATTTNSSFRKYRDACNDSAIHRPLQQALQDMTLELTNFNQRCIDEGPEVDTNALNVLTVAETYCKNALHKRLKELSLLCDPVIKLKEIAALEELLESVRSPTLRR